jgi:hypothetical protein
MQAFRRCGSSSPVWLQDCGPSVAGWRFVAFVAGAAMIGSTLTGCGSMSAGSPPPAPVVAPSNLTYVTATLSATVGVPIPSDSASVGGSPATFSVSPVLPAGLALDAATGTISGTPTAIASSANYVVKAANSAGSTTATLTVAVVVAKPSNLAYAESVVNDVLGAAMPADSPSFNSTVDSFSIAPVLPPGLVLDSSSGVLSGTPASTSPATVYTVTAENSSGSATTQLTISVNAQETVLLEQGHGNSILAIRSTAANVLSEDTSGHWVLWDYASGAIIASGDGANTANQNQIDLAGQLAVVATAQQVQMYSVTDGHRILSIPTPSWWRLATDGSYLCAGSSTSLTTWSSAGEQTFSLVGDYHAALPYAAPGQIELAGGPSGPNVIETDSYPGGVSAVSAQFSGTFHAWFLDGHRFVTNLGNTVWVYSSGAVQQALLTLPSINNLTGQGNWFWVTIPGSPSDEVDVYAVGGSAPAQVFTFPTNSTYVASGESIGILQLGTPAMSVVDLSGSTPVRSDFSIPPIANLSAFAAASPSQWVAGNFHGVLLDGASLTSTRRYFGFGAVFDIAGSSNAAVVSTAIGKVLVFNPATATQIEAIDFLGGKLALSSDGNVLAAAGEALDYQNVPDRTLNLYSLPSKAPSTSFVYSYNDSSPFLLDFSLSSSGTVLGQVLENGGSSGITGYSRIVTDLTNDATIWADAGVAYEFSTPILLSPDGTLIAIASDGNSSSAASFVTNIYRDGVLNGAAAGTGQGWSDNGHLLVLNWTDGFMGEGPDYSGSSLVDPTGVVLSTIPLTAMPEILGCFQSPTNQCPQFPVQDRFYDPRTNSIYSLPTGALLWQIPFQAAQDTGVGAVAGSMIVFETGHQVIAATGP